MAVKKKATQITLQPLDALFGSSGDEQTGICEVVLSSLHPFPNHPFKVLDDEKMIELSDSIKQHGVLIPGIVRLKPSGGYELVAAIAARGHVKLLAWKPCRLL